MEEITKVPDQIKETLALVEKLRTHLETQIEDQLTNEGEVNLGHTRALKELATAVSSLSRESRSWVGTQEKVIQTMTQWQKNKIFKKYFMGLPKNQRIKMYREIFNEERKIPNGIQCRLVKE